MISGKKYRGAHKTLTLEDGYLGSGVAITAALKKYGPENFSRTILCYCDSVDEMIIQEAKYVDQEWVDSDRTYNLQTGGLSYGILSSESKRKISETLKEKYATGEIVPGKPMLGKTPWNKDKVDVFSLETLEKMRAKKEGYVPHNKGQKGLQVAWNKGKKTGPHTEESNQKRSETLIERYKTTEHPRTGKSSWCAGTKGQGVVKAWNKGKEMPVFECEHCGKKVKGLGNLSRWHNDNCKAKRRH